MALNAPLTKLTEALDELAQARRMGDVATAQGMIAGAGSEFAPAQLRPVLEIARSSDQLRVFDGAWPFVAGARLPKFTLEFVLAWLWKRASQVGAAQALNELLAFDGGSYQCPAVALVTNFRIDRRYVLPTAGVELFPIGEVIDTPWLLSEAHGVFGSQRTAWPAFFSFYRVTGLWRKTITVDAALKSSDDEAGAYERQAVHWFHEHLEPLLALTFLRDGCPFGALPVAVSVNTEGVRSLPVDYVAPRNFDALYRAAGPPTQPWTADHLTQLDERYAQFARMAPDDQARLRVPLTRLRSAISERDATSLAIDLRVALECTFDRFPEKSGKTARVVKNAQAFLAADPRRTRAIYKELSVSVHQGKAAAASRDWQTLITDGMNMVREAILKMLAQGRYEQWPAS